MDSILTNNHLFDDQMIDNNNNNNNNNSSNNPNNNNNNSTNNSMSRNSSNGLNLSVNDIIPGESDDLFNEFLDMRLYDKNGQPIQQQQQQQQPGFQQQNFMQQQQQQIQQQQQNLQLQKQLQNAQLQLSQSNNLKFETGEFIYDDFLDQEMDTIENGLNDNIFNQNSIQSTRTSTTTTTTISPSGLSNQMSNSNSISNSNSNPNDNFEKLIKFEENVSKELPNINSNNPDLNLQTSNISNHHESDEFKNYDDSRKELMKLRFGNPKKNSIDSNNNTNNKNNMNLDNDDSDDDDDETNSNRGGSNTIRFDSVQKLNKNFEFNEDNNPLNNSSIIPSEYLNDDISNLPYNLKINELPQCSRVETQIKIQLSISPPPPQFLLHIPKDTISKPKLSLNGPIPDSIKNHLLYLDSFVVPSSMLDDTDSLVSSPNSPSSNTNNNTNSNKLRSCNICKRCMRRELKRASRRKATNSNDSNKWSLDSPKRAIMFNCKEIISFPRPTGNNSSHKDIELLSRIICYCRHHQEPKGFKLLFILKDNNDKVIGRCFSNPIMIMDRKKPTRPSTKNPNNNNIDNTINNNNGATDNNNSDFQTNDSNTQTNNDDDNDNNTTTTNNLKRKSTSQQQPQTQVAIKKESIASTTTTTTTNNEFDEDIFTNGNNSSNRPLSPSSFYESSSDVLNFSDVNNMPPSSINPRDSSISITNNKNNTNNNLPLRKNSSSVLLNNISSITNASAAASAVSASVAAATAAAGGIQVLPSDLRSKKRQKRSFSPEDSTTTSIVNTNNTIVNSRQNSLSSTRKDSLSPTSSDQLSPHNTLNSGASVFSTTPDRNVNYQSSTSVGSSGRVSSLEEQQKRIRHQQQHQQQHHHQQQQQQQQQQQIGGPIFHQMPPQSQQFQPMMPQMMSQQQRLQQQPSQQMFPQHLSSDFSPMSMPQVPPNGQVPPMLLQQPQSQQQSQRGSPMSIQQQSASTTSATSAAASAANQPVIQRIIPAQGPVRGGVEITLLGCNFRPGLSVKFGANVSLATHCWSDSTIVTYLPPASSAGPVLVTFTEDGTNREYLLNSSSNQIFTYTDDTDKQLIELALQIVGLKMNGKLEDAKNIAKRIIGNNNTNGGGSNGETIDSNSAGGGASTSMDTSISQDSNNSNYELWLEQASAKIEQLSKSGFNYEQILIKFLSMLQLPNSPISQPNWAICNNEGQTLLHLACLKNYYKLSLFLLHRGSKVNFHDVNNLSPLHYSLINGNRDLFKLLIKYKANLSIKIKNGVTIRDIADSNVLDLINEYGNNEEDGFHDNNSNIVKDINNTNDSNKNKEIIDDFGRRRLSNDSLSSLASSFDSKGVEESLELDLDLIKPTFKSFNKTGVVKSDFFEDDYSDFADDEQQWEDGDNYDYDNDDEYSIGRNDIGELKSIKSFNKNDENSSIYLNDNNNNNVITTTFNNTTVEIEKIVNNDDHDDNNDNDVVSDKIDIDELLEIKKIDSIIKSELENDSIMSKSSEIKNNVTFADSFSVQNDKDNKDVNNKDHDDETILAKSTIFDTNKLIGRSLWGKMKKAFRYTPILNKSSLSGLSSNEDNQTDFGEITENNDNATIIDGNESSNESVYLPRDIETRFNGFKRFANHISETFENVGGGDSCDIRSRFINGEQISSQNETPEVQTQDERSVTPQEEQEPQQRDDDNNNKEEEEEEEENDELPRYEDLFPNGASLRSFMNFGFDIKTPTDVLTSSSDKAISTIEEEIIEEREGFSQLEQAQQQQQLNKNEIIMVTNTNLINNVNDIIDNESGEESETSQDDLFFNFFNTSNTKTIKADFRLLFFWLPFMLLLMMIFINKQFNIKFLNFEIINSFYYKFIENIRWIMANFMLGKERVENLLNDAHEAVLTAVSGR